MQEQKTRPDTGDVAAFISGLDDPAQRGACHDLIDLLAGVTGEPPVLWGTMIGFGRYHYKYASGHEGEAFLVGFALRKAEFSIYLGGDAAGGREALLAKLGKHRMGKGCLYVKRLSDINMDVLRALAQTSVAALRTAYPPE